MATTLSSSFSGKQLSCDAVQSISAEELLTRILEESVSFQALMFVPVALLAVMILMSIDGAIFLLRNSRNTKQTRATLLIISIYPVMGSLCVAGMFMPRTAAPLTFARNFYFSFAMKKFFDLILMYYGGKSQMESALQGDSTVTFNPVPCCFVCCCRNQRMTKSRIVCLKLAVYQVVIIFPIAYFIETLFVAEDLVRTDGIAQIISLLIEVIVTTSGLVCLYGFVVIGRSSSHALKSYNVFGKYFSISLIVACNNFQNVILQVLVRINALPCGFPYPDPAQAFLYQSYILFLELFAISLLGWYSYRREEQRCESRREVEQFPSHDTNRPTDNGNRDVQENVDLWLRSNAHFMPIVA